MAYRCKTCGYRFKSGDSDLCPECFTARDDIGCETFDKKHTHFKDSYKESNDFLEDQLKEESKSGIGGEKTYERPADAYADRRTNAYRANASSGYTQFNGANNYARYPNNANIPYNAGAKVKSSPKHSGCAVFLVVVVIVLIAASSILPAVFSFIRSKISGYYDEENGADTQTHFSASAGFTVNSDDGRFTAYAQNTKLVSSYDSLRDAQVNGGDLTVSYTDVDFYNEEHPYTLICMDIYFYSGDDCVIKDISLIADGDDGEELFSTSPDLGTERRYSYETPLLICEDIENYRLQLELGDGEYYDTLEFEMTYSQIMENAENSGENAGFKTSLEDTEGKNVRLKCVSKDRESFDGETTENEYLTLDDESLSDDGWFTAEFELTDADSNEPLDFDYDLAFFTAYDSENNSLYYFTTYDLERIIMHEDAELYDLTVYYTDSSGEYDSCFMTFTAEEFLASSEE